ncbi:MAG: transposase family protein [Candidatus Marinimicrobia bacterium]|nr:transposase family protein [Candidatus Neomarinimicrobiota bacterium]
MPHLKRHYFTEKECLMGKIENPNKISKKARRELIEVMRPQYQTASWLDKMKILDGIVAATKYDRKYATRLLNKPIVKKGENFNKKKQNPRLYDEHVKNALFSVWYSANQICSKRLVPFLPDFVESLERHGHLRLTKDVKDKLLKISPATVDRMLKPERQRIGKSPGTTKSGSLLKHQIKVRTFTDWDDVIPGFLEIDTVAHCGGDISGQFINTLTLVDIATGWVELIPLLRKSPSDVIAGLNIVKKLLPFSMLGLDTDNGSEFINFDVLDYCEENEITFTRSRAYRKNDQAHVEEKNGSIVRRLVGYDRFEGKQAWIAMSQLYRYLRNYINFFQPSMKLASKSRQGAKVTKKYHAAKTPYQRILINDAISNSVKNKLGQQYYKLDPVKLMDQLEQSQRALFKYGWMPLETTAPLIETDKKLEKEIELLIDVPKLKLYSVGKKPDGRSKPWKTSSRPDLFASVWDKLRLKLELNPEKTAKSLMEELVEKDPSNFKISQLRTLQRKVKKWREKQTIYEDQIEEILNSESKSKSRDQEKETVSQN